MADQVLMPGRLAAPEVRLFEAAEAVRLLEDSGFRREWDTLLAACHWGTVFQSPGFVTTWFEVYRERFEPVIALGRGPDGALLGAFFLARNRSTGDLVFAGAHQAEYHTFLAHGCDAGLFLQAVVGALKKVGAQPGLRFHFLAPGTPSDWTMPEGRKGLRLHAQTHVRPIMGLTDPESVEAPLQKKRFRTRISRLARFGGGDVRLVQLHSSNELLPYLDEIIVQCDLRQGAVNRNTPFRSDPDKRAFYLRMLDIPGQMHATVLLVGDRVAAAHVGPVSGRQVVFGLIVHSAAFAAHSPGKLLVLLLGQLLASQGYEALDLTPGEGYKNQFATHTDAVWSVQLYWETGAFLRQSLRAGLRRGAVRMARSVGMESATADRLKVHFHRALNWRRWPNAASVLVRRTPALIWSTVEYRIYVAPHDPPVGREPHADRLRCQHPADLLDFAPASGLLDDYYAFLSQALARLERGQLCYTYAAEGMLLHYSWLIPAVQECGTGLGHPPLRFAEESAVLWDDFTHPSGRGQGLHSQSIRLRLADVRRIDPTRKAFVGILADNRASRRNYERLGFAHVASAWYRRRLGRVERWIEIPGSSAAHFERAEATGGGEPGSPSARGSDPSGDYE